MTLRGVSVRGTEVLAPSDISNLRSWYKWKTGVTVDGSNKVTNWADQGPDARAFVQGVAAQRPAYDADTGKIQGDGVDDNLLTSTYATLWPNDQEYWFVTETPPASTSGALFSRVRTGNSSDGDSLSLRVYPYRQWFRSTAVGTGSQMYTVTNAEAIPVAGIKYVICFAQSWWYCNGVIPQFQVRHDNTLGPDLAIPYSRLLATGGGTGGANAFSRNPVYECCFFGKKLSAAERNKLLNYFKLVHTID